MTMGAATTPRRTWRTRAFTGSPRIDQLGLRLSTGAVEELQSVAWREAENGADLVPLVGLQLDGGPAECAGRDLNPVHGLRSASSAHSP